jgi:hypothetical protein
MKQPDHAMDAFEEERVPRDSDDWESFSAQPLPSGTIRIIRIAGVAPARLAIDNPEQPAVTYADTAGEYRHVLTAPQTLMFRLEVAPSYERGWRPENDNPDAQPGSGADLETVWRFGDAGSIRFEYGNGRYGPPSRQAIHCEPDQQANARGFCALNHEPDPKRCVRGKA